MFPVAPVPASSWYHVFHCSGIVSASSLLSSMVQPDIGSTVAEPVNGLKPS